MNRNKTNFDFGAALQAAVMAQEGEKAWDKRDVDIEHSGTKITLPGEPGPMPLRKAIEALERKAADEETELDVHEILNAYPEDALVALNSAMRQKYGWASPTPKMSFFGPIAPDLITVKTCPGIPDPQTTLREVGAALGRRSFVKLHSSPWSDAYLGAGIEAICWEDAETGELTIIDLEDGEMTVHVYRGECAWRLPLDGSAPEHLHGELEPGDPLWHFQGEAQA